MSLETILEELFAVIVSEARSNPEFSERLGKVLEAPSSPKMAKRSGRRTPAVFDPFELVQDGEEVLRSRLAQLTVEQLKDIVAEQGMDRAKLAMKWKASDRLVDLIVTTVQNRAKKGSAFRDSS